MKALLKVTRYALALYGAIVLAKKIEDKIMESKKDIPEEESAFNYGTVKIYSDNEVKDLFDICRKINIICGSNGSISMSDIYAIVVAYEKCSCYPAVEIMPLEWSSYIWTKDEFHPRLEKDEENGNTYLELGRPFPKHTEKEVNDIHGKE